jgi:hypothetical protein
MRQRATRGLLKPQRAPAREATIPLALDLPAADFARLRIGFAPQEMEDKRLAFIEDDTLHLHRSWTGFWHASVAFQRDGGVYRATPASVNRDPQQYAGTDYAADAATIRKLIAGFIEENAAWVPLRGRNEKLDTRPLLAQLFDDGQIRLERAPVLDRQPEPLPDGFDFDRVEGMLLGLAIGDALGNTTEGLSPAERADAHGEITGYLPSRHDKQGRAVGLPSDDSQLAFWTLEQITADGGIDAERLARRLSGQRIFGIGNTVRQFVAGSKTRACRGRRPASTPPATALSCASRPSW